MEKWKTEKFLTTMSKMNLERLFYLTFIIVVSLLSKIPFISINMLLPFPEWLVWSCVVSNVISWFLLEIWALGLEASFFLREAKINTLNGFFLSILIIILALISQVPNVFPALQYNPKIYHPYITVCVLIALSFFPIKSLILTCKKIHRFIYLSSEENKIINKTNGLRQHYFKMSFDDKMKIPFSSDISVPSNELNEYNLEDKYDFNIGTFLGGVIVIFYEYFNAEYSFVKWNEFVSSDGYSSYILSILVVITTFYLTGITVINIFESLFRPNLKYKYESFFICYIVTQILIFISSILSVGVYLVVVSDFYHDQEIKKYSFTICCCITIFMILETGSYAMVDYLFDYIISKYGTINDKKLIEINTKISLMTIDRILKIGDIDIRIEKSIKERVMEMLSYNSNLINNENDEMNDIIINEEKEYTKV